MLYRNDCYYMWIGYESMPPRCRTWIENPSGYVYPVHSRREGRRLVQEWGFSCYLCGR